MSKCVNDGMTDIRCDEESTCMPFLKGSIDITIEEQKEDGSPSLIDKNRYVRVCGSIEDCRTYPVPIDSTTGFGQVHIEEIQSVQNVVVLVDDQDMQVVNGDDYAVGYYVNQEKMEEDHASFVLSDEENDHVDIHIVNRELQSTALEIFKVLRDEFGDSMALKDCMEFVLTINGMDMCEEVVLNADNDFHAYLENVLPGEYIVKEQYVNGFETYYRLNGGEERTLHTICIEPGHNELQMINRRSSQSLLTIEKFIRDRNGELIKPQNDETFAIRVISRTFDQRYELNYKNDFAVDLEALEPGFYDISEISEGCYDTTYLVNGEREIDYAHVEVRKCVASSVMIINSLRDDCCACDSPLRICKFVRGKDGCLQKPNQDECFKVMLSGCGIYQTFNLNACNNFCVDIDHICCGEYEIKEIDNCDYNTSYIVNDGCERTSAFVCIHECETNCVTIINEQKNKGSACICKYMKDRYGNLVKPNKEDRFVVTLRSYCFHETFILDECNDWCMYFNNLREGSYEARERSCDDFNTTYIVNGCKERRHGRFVVDNDCTNEIRIVNEVKREGCGLLKINKFIEKSNRDFVKPDSDEEFEVMVQGENFKECFKLHCKNNWCIVLEGLGKGEYHIVECDNEYDVTYVVDGCEQSEAIICLGDENQEISIINHERRGGTMTISSLIRTCDDEYERPSRTACFEVMVEGNGETKTYTLDRRNRFTILLDDVKDGTYRITQKDSYGYEVTYEIGEDESPRGRVEMCGQNEEITIINSMTNCQGMVRITKYIIDEYGKKQKPCIQDCFKLLLKSNNYKKEITLDDDNDFCVFFDDLREGNYKLKETCDNYDVSYVVNGECKQDGSFVLGRCDVDIEVWNTPRPQPILCVQKRMRIDGCLEFPRPCEEFEFVLKGINVHEVYKLNEGNNWCICLCELQNQHYEVKELHGCNVSYMIDDCVQSDGYFLFKDKDMTITIINEEPCDDRIKICKCIEENGKQCKPYRWESFDIIIEGRNFKQCYTLNCDNDWCLDVMDLKPGSYEVKELGDYKNSYVINGCIEKTGCFYVGQGDVSIDIINHMESLGNMKICAFNECYDERYQPSGDDTFIFSMQYKDDKKTYKLEECNCWCLNFDDMKLGEYIITSSDERVQFDVTGQMMKKARFVLDDTAQNIALLRNTCCDTHELHVRKMIKDDCGCEMKPISGSYDVRITTKDGMDLYSLNESNQWHILLKDVKEGLVEIEEVDIPEVRYRVNSSSLRSQAKFMLCEDSEVIVLNPQPVCGDLRINAMIEDCDGTNRNPEKEDKFEIQLTAEGVNENFQLNQKNDWKKEFTGLLDGEYSVVVDHFGYDHISYMLNGEEIDTPNFAIQNEDAEFTIVFHTACTEANFHTMIQNCDGTIINPKSDEQFTITLSNKDTSKSFMLNQQNNWTKNFTDLKNGMYKVQIDDHEYDHLTYTVNGTPQSDPSFSIEEGDVHFVIILHPICKEGILEILKYKKDSNCGCFVRPCMDESYEMRVVGNNFDKTITLNDANHWRYRFHHLAVGTYEISEVNSNDDVSFIVNGGKETDRGIVEVGNGSSYVKVINQKHKDYSGTIEICKYIEDEDGMHRPNKDARYSIILKSEYETKRFLLTQANDFCATAQALPDGRYEIMEERPNGKVTYSVNNAIPTKTGVIQVLQNHNTVKVINEASESAGKISIAKFIRVNSELKTPVGKEYRIHISRPEFNKVITLNEDNDYQMVLTNLENGWYVIDELDYEFVTYRINGGSEVDSGIVKVQNDEHDVWIINEEDGNTTGSITLTKYIRNDQSFVKPQMDDSFRFHVSRAGFNQVYTLDQSNDWTVVISNIDNGTYVIQELDQTGDVTYIVNGGSEIDNGIVDVKNNANSVFIINTEKTSAGRIHIEKYMRMSDGTLARPEESFTAQVHISRPGFNNVYTLNSSNQWTLDLSDLENGLYVIDELNSDNKVTYTINGGSEVSNAIVDVANNTNQVRMINDTRATQGGSIAITKYIRNESGEVVRPRSDFTTRVHVTRSGYNEFFTLNQANNFSIIIRDLMPGLYVITEPDYEDRVTYVINGGNEVNNAVVDVRNNANQVYMINRLSPEQNLLRITKVIRNETGQLVQPGDDESFRVLLMSSGTTRNIILEKNNNWNVELRNLANGPYTIRESGSMYDVVYIVNNQGESAQANVQLNNNEQTVKIINQMSSYNNRLEISKLMKDEHGALIRPTQGEEYQVHISNNNFDELITLNDANNFTMVFNDLATGMYVVREVTNNGYSVTYRMNGGQEVDSAEVIMDKGSTSLVEVINEKTENLNTLEVFKYILDDHGNFIKPKASESFKVTISGNDFEKEYDLNEANRWHFVTQRLMNGSYTLQESGDSNYQVQYLVNGGVIGNSAEFEVKPGMNNIIEIINAKNMTQDGRIEITKRIRNGQGNVSLPSNAASFHIRLSSQSGFDETYTLNTQNNYTVQLSELAHDMYTVEELDATSYDVSFIINSEDESMNSSVEVNDNSTNRIMIMNTTTTMSYRVDTNSDLKIVID